MREKLEVPLYLDRIVFTITNFFLSRQLKIILRMFGLKEFL